MHVLILLLFLPHFTIQGKKTSTPTPPEALNHCFDNTNLAVRAYPKAILKKVNELLCKKPTPYCDFSTNICVSEPPELDFQCDVDGVYPYANSCSGSFNCSGGKLTRNECPQKTYYNYKKKMCTKSKSCHLPKCKGKSGDYVKHPEDKSLIVLCTGGQASSMRVCPINHEFTPGNDLLCKFICKRAGYFPNFRNRQMFYNCTKAAGRLRLTEHTCPMDEVFHQKNNAGGYHCAPGQNFLKQGTTLPTFEDSSSPTVITTVLATSSEATHTTIIPNDSMEDLEGF